MQPKDTEVTPQPKTIYLKDYRPPSHLIDEARLRFDLREDRAIVANSMRVRRNEHPQAESGPLALDGEGLRLLSISIDGTPLAPGDYEEREGRLVVLREASPSFLLELVTECEPQKNLAFDGLYRSNGMFCTQCEAEGFRRIAYYLDRPDVMARFRVAIEADQAKYPILLSNGNLVSQRALPGGRHEAIWDDPFKKPCYLFAMVAGDLGCLEGEFARRSGKPAKLRVYSEKGLEGRCQHALDSLKRAMKWDEDVFGLEYDLDTYMIVVANDFNMGAMENKGLNVFNSTYVLARPETATDADYNGIMAVVGHEYFHNWTGNRVTCRDWFQLSLKEGLTVFRDQQFSGDMGSVAVNRIEDVIRLRAAQFAEDAGPMAHPIRPQSYISINNFYTTTVYEKGAEVVRMIHTILGPAAFRRGMDKYFELFDGQAVTTDDFVRAMELASGEDLAQFRNWYAQAGTPVVRARLARDPAGRLRLDLSQSCPATPGQADKTPFHIPFALGLLDATGSDIPLRLEGEPASAARATRVLHLREREQSFLFASEIPATATPSYLRGFSAPVRLDAEFSDHELAFLLASDSDPFARWEAAQRLALRELARLVGEFKSGRMGKPRPEVVEPFARLARAFAEAFAAGAAAAAHSPAGGAKATGHNPAGSGAAGDPAFIALMLLLPSEQYLAQQFEVVDPDAVHAAREALRGTLGAAARADLEAIYRSLHPISQEGRDAASAGRRALKNRCLKYLCQLGEPEYERLAAEQMRGARCMTDELGALSALVQRQTPQRERALGAFYAKWKSEPLVMNKWLSLQATSAAPDAVERVRRLAADPVFDKSNPNKIYNLFGHFATLNLSRFHSLDGSGYRLMADQVLDIESRNPQVAARLMGAFNQWRRFDSSRQALMRGEISRILAKPGLSSDIYEIASKALA